ncbi:MAG: LuxR C-terminal-related transcriptional regulator [Anaerolineae bacterium]
MTVTPAAVSYCPIDLKDRWPMDAALEIYAKLRTPRLGADLVSRPRLQRLLDKGPQVALTLVCAPAGFGKTTLLVEWLATRSLPSAWVSLGSDDSNITVFTRLLVFAIRRVFPGACEATLSILRSTQPLKPSALATHLANDIAELPGACVVVLDDYHAIRDMAAHQMMAALLDNLPPTLHVAIATRSDPPLPLPRLLARGQMIEVRAADLRFTRDEVQQFLTHATGKAPDEAALAMLAERTEGWAAGLRLAALSLRGQPDAATLADALGPRATRYIMDYLLDEALSRQRHEVQRFLLATSILDSFNASLAAAVALGGDLGASEALIEEIARANLFLVALDETRDWYRYYHLFRDLLRHKLHQTLDPAAIGALHARACAWLAERGAVADAIHHALDGGDETQAARLVEANIHGAVLEDNRLAIKHWLDMLPPGLIERRPGLLVARCWVLAAGDSADALAPLLRQAEALLTQPDLDLRAEDRRALEGDIALFWAQSSVYTLHGECALAAAQRALDYIPPHHAYARGFAMRYLVTSLQLVGRKADAVALLEEELKSNPFMPPAQKALVFTGLMLVNFAAGDLVAAAEAGRAALPPAGERPHQSHLVSHIYPILGHIYYELNDLDTTIAYCQACPSFERSGHLWGAYESRAMLMLCYAARGQFAEAHRVLNSLLDLVGQFDDPTLVSRARGLAARLALVEGDLPAALAWASAPAAKDKGLVRLEVPDITRARIWAASGTPGDARRALDVLGYLIAAAEASHTDWRLALLLAVKAVALDTLGEADNALETLRRSVAIAGPHGYARTYLDNGPRMASLLHRLAQRGIECDYITHLLSLFPQAPPIVRDAPRSDDLVEPLTTREMQVLEMLGRRLSDKEIAAALVISPLTARSHMTHIFAKLGVHSRRAAVAQARRLGLLGPP